MTKKRLYEKPSMRTFELRQKPALLAGSNPAPNQATVEDYQDGEFSW